MPTRRQRQVAELVHRELSSLLLFEVRDPRLEGLTITEVRVTPDLLLARIFFTLLDKESPVQEAQSALESASGFLRSKLGARVRLRSVPELVFMHDSSAAYGQQIDALLDQIAEEDAARGASSEADETPGEEGDLRDARS
jgi:ribosome-binding factor A